MNAVETSDKASSVSSAVSGKYSNGAPVVAVLAYGIPTTGVEFFSR